MVYEGQPEKPPPIKDEDRAPFWEGLGEKISDKISEFDKEEVGHIYTTWLSSSTCIYNSTGNKAARPLPELLFELLGTELRACFICVSNLHWAQLF